MTHNSKSKGCYNVKHSAYYFYVKTKVSVDLQTCISVPLMRKLTKAYELTVSAIQTNGNGTMYV